MKHEYSLQVFEKKKPIQISNFMKIRPAVAEMIHADRQTDVTKLIVTFFFFNFAKAPKKSPNGQCQLFYVLLYDVTLSLVTMA